MAEKYAPFYGDDGKQIGWQSSDLSTVYGMTNLPADAEVDMPEAPWGSAMAATTNDPLATLPPGFTIQPPAGSSAPSRSAAVDSLPPGFTIQGNTVPLDKALDRKHGAPHNVRELVGSAPDQDRLTQIQRFYPDAQPYEDDNFVFRHPDTGRPTLYNPPGFEMGDVASVGREIASGIGSTVGAGAAAASAPFTAGLGAAAIPVGAGAGAVAGSAIYDAGRRFLMDGVDSRSPVETTRDAGVEFGVNAVAQGVGDMIPGLLRKTPFLFKPNPVTGMTRDDTYRAYQELGIKPTAGQVTGSKLYQRLEEAASKSPGGTNTMGAVAREQNGLLQTAVNDLADQYGTSVYANARPGGSPTEAGRALQRGAADFVEGFRGRSQLLYDELYDVMDPKAVVPASNTMQVLDQMGQQFAATPELAKRLDNSVLRGWREALVKDGGPNGEVPYDVLQRFRSKIGNMISEPMTVGDIHRGELKQVYAGLSRDMEVAAQAAGPDALRKFERANNFYSAGLKRIEDTLDGVLNSDTPERAFRFAMEGTGAKTGGGSRLWALRRSLGSEGEWDVVASSVLRRMGDANPGQQGAETVFSPATFLTNWNKLSPQARDALFKGGSYENLAPKLDKLNRVLSSVKDSAWLSNPSGTAGQQLYNSLLTFGLGSGGGAGLSGLLGTGTGGTSLGVGMLSLASVTIAPYTWAKVLTNPRFVDWLADAGVVQASGNDITKILPRLYAIAEADPFVEELADGFFRNQKDAEQQPGTPTQPRRGLLN